MSARICSESKSLSIQQEVISPEQLSSLPKHVVDSLPLATGVSTGPGCPSISLLQMYQSVSRELSGGGGIGDDSRLHATLSSLHHFLRSDFEPFMRPTPCCIDLPLVKGASGPPPPESSSKLVVSAWYSISGKKLSQ